MDTNERLDKLEKRVDDIENFLKKFIEKLEEIAKKKKEKSKSILEDYYKIF